MNATFKDNRDLACDALLGLEHRSLRIDPFLDQFLPGFQTKMRRGVFGGHHVFLANTGLALLPLSLFSIDSFEGEMIWVFSRSKEGLQDNIITNYIKP